MPWTTAIFILLLAVWLAWFVVAMGLSAVMAMLVVMVGAAGFTMALLGMAWVCAAWEKGAAVWRKARGVIAKDLREFRKGHRAR